MRARDAPPAISRRSASSRCVVDLEDELIRALGGDGVQRVAERQGDLRAFRTLQNQPEWRGRPVDEHLRRWLGSGGRRKTRYGALLVEALELDRVPRPLARLLEYAFAARRGHGAPGQVPGPVPGPVPGSGAATGA